MDIPRVTLATVCCRLDGRAIGIHFLVWEKFHLFYAASRVAPGPHSASYPVGYQGQVPRVAVFMIAWIKSSTRLCVLVARCLIKYKVELTFISASELH